MFGNNREVAYAASLFVLGVFMNKKGVRGVLKRHAAELMATPGVVGIGVGKFKGLPCILVFVTEMKAAALSQIPNALDGYVVQIKESGDFQARVGAI